MWASPSAASDAPTAEGEQAAAESRLQSLEQQPIPPQAVRRSRRGEVVRLEGAETSAIRILERESGDHVTMQFRHLVAQDEIVDPLRPRRREHGVPASEL